MRSQISITVAGGLRHAVQELLPVAGAIAEGGGIDVAVVAIHDLHGGLLFLVVIVVVNARRFDAAEMVVVKEKNYTVHRLSSYRQNSVAMMFFMSRLV